MHRICFFTLLLGFLAGIILNGELGDNKLYQMLAEKAQHVHPFVFNEATMRKVSSAALKDIWQKVKAGCSEISEKGFRGAKKAKG